jgi:TPR repeat protein
LSRQKAILLAAIVSSCGTTQQSSPGPPAGARPEAAPRVVAAPTTSGTTEVEQWRGKCDSGDQGACNNLAFLIEQKRPDVAKRLYEQACEHDIPPACHNLGVVIHQHGDLGRAVPLFVKACGLSHVPACETLRSMMNAQEKRTGTISCLEIAMKGGTVGHVCSNLSNSGDWDKLMEDLRKPQ